MQMVFQDPYSSIDPRYTRARRAARALASCRAWTPRAVDELMAMVGLNPSLAAAAPAPAVRRAEAARGHCARAGAAGPFLVLDEPTASLDVSIQAQIIGLLEGLQRDLGLTYLFISHDLGLVRYFCDRIVVMYLGRIVEVLPGPGSAPRHPYTVALMDSTFEPDPARRRVVTLLTGEIPDAFNPPPGCAYAARCPQRQRALPQRTPRAGTLR
jgi:oligopeptide/dipeptide ABC transporter ATP-binding protein